MSTKFRVMLLAMTSRAQVTFIFFAAITLLSCGDSLTKTLDGAIANEPDATTAACETVTSDAHIVYLNRFAGTYSGSNDTSPANNESELVSGTATLAAWDVPTEGFIAMQLCLAEVLAPFNVAITDTEPAAEPYHEIAFTGSNSDLIVGPSDVTSLADFGCTPADNTISFVFAGNDNPLTACQSAAFVVGFSQGLSRVAENCEDAMTFASACTSQVEFADVIQACGNRDGVPSSCICHQGLTQNSFQLLTSTFGACPQ